MSTEKPTLRVSYWVKPNRYGGKCVACACDVLEGNGWTQRDGDTWQTVCRDCAKANARALPVIVNGNTTHLAGLNNNSDGGALYVCCKCHSEVALVKGRSGKWYFCEIAGGQTGRRYAATHAPHTMENCDAIVERYDEFATAEALKAAQAAHAAIVGPLVDQAFIELDAALAAAGNDDDKRAAADRHRARVEAIYAKYPKPGGN